MSKAQKSSLKPSKKEGSKRACVIFGSSSAGEHLEGDEVAKGKGNCRSGGGGRQGQERNMEKFGVIRRVWK